MTSPKVALIETKPSKTDFYAELELDFDRYALCSDPSIKKVLRADCDIDINLDEYDWVILVGSEPLKYFTKLTSITEYSGKKVDKFIPAINPSMLSFKPEARPVWNRTKQSIIDYITGNKEDIEITDKIAEGIQDTKRAKEVIKRAIKFNKPYFSLDSETTGLYPRNGYMLGFSLSYDGKKGYYIDTDCIDEELESLMQELFNKKATIFHNAKFDLAFFEYHFGFTFPKFEDTMLLHYLIDENPGTHGLKPLAMKYTPYGDYEKPMYEWMDKYRKQHGVLKSEFKWEWIPFDVMYPYAATDALVTFQLFEKFQKIKQNKKLARVYDEILIPGCRFLTNIQDNGVPFSKERLIKAQSIMQQSIDESVQKLKENPQVQKFIEINGEFNPNSTVQLRKLLFDFVGLRPTGKKTGTGADSTDKEVLAELAEQSDIPALILTIREKSKIKNTYLDKIIPQLDSDSRLRTNFNLHSTTSGRLSSSGKLNMQQLPRDNPAVKGCIMAAPGHKIVAMDLTTAEMYYAAVLSKDRNLMEVFRSGGNFHSTIAKKVFNLSCPVEEVADKFSELRQASKAVSFGILYGASAAKVSETVSKDLGRHFSKQEAQEVIDDYFKAFPQLKKWIDSSIASIERNGYIYSAFGRKRRLPNVSSSDRGIKGHAIRSGLNFTIQSVSSDINLLGAIEAEQELKAKGFKARMFALVHDSILAEVPDEEVEDYKKILKSCIQRDRGLNIPGAPIGCEFEVVYQDYSNGKFEEKFGV